MFGSQGHGSSLERAARLPWYATLGFASLFGHALAKSGPPDSYVAPAFFVAAGLALLLEPARQIGSRRYAALVGFAFGLGFAHTTTDWVEPTVARFAGLGRVAAIATRLLLEVVEALPPAIACAAYGRMSRPNGPALALTLAVAFTWVPMFAPWRPIALALPFAPVGVHLGLVGPTVAEFALLVPAAFLVTPASRRRRFLAAGVALAALLGIGFLRVVRLADDAQRVPQERIVAIQPNVSIAEGQDRTRRRARLDLLRAATRRASVFDPDVIVWPESAHPYVLDRDATRDLSPPFDTGVRGSRARVIVGALSERSRCERWNGVVAFDPRGRRIGRVDKRYRVPFADFLPLSSWFGPDERCRDLSPARDTTPIAGRVGALVCYDEVVSTPARDDAARGARYLVGFTNDAWFDGTRQPWLQGRVARMRALETGLDLVRVVNTGGSEHIGADGRVLGRHPVGRAGHFVADVPVRASAAPAVWIGRPLDLLALVLVLAMLWTQRRGKSSGGGGR